MQLRGRGGSKLWILGRHEGHGWGKAGGRWIDSCHRGVIGITNWMAGTQERQQLQSQRLALKDQAHVADARGSVIPAQGSRCRPPYATQAAQVVMQDHACKSALFEHDLPAGAPPSPAEEVTSTVCGTPRGRI